MMCRMRSFSRILAVALAVVVTTAQAAGATPNLTAAEIIAVPFDRDGETLTFEGEAIGDVLSAEDGHVWVNVSSGGAAFGVWAPDEMVDVKILGRYGVVGDTVRARGVYNTACDMHGGDMDMHATSIEILSQGRRVPPPVRWWKLPAAVGLALLGGAIALRYRFRQNEAG